jgi:hypothetical protein
MKTKLNALKGVRVENMVSQKGNYVPNQFLIYTPNGVVFQSYSSVIAIKTSGGIILDKDTWDYSPTAGKYRNIFLGEGKRATEKKIKNGIYKLADLNKE